MRHVSECVTCQQNKSEYALPVGLLHPLPIPEHKWESISMDFITGLSKVQGKDCIYVVVNRLTKFAHFYAIPTEYSGTSSVTGTVSVEIWVPWKVVPMCL
jgi:hypothetical protein